MTAPDLKDPAALAAYRRELRGVLPVFRRIAVATAVLGGFYAIARVQLALDWPAWPGRVAVIAGLVMMAIAIVIRTRYHRARMRGLR